MMMQWEIGAPDGTYIPDLEVDCGWRAPEGE